MTVNDRRLARPVAYPGSHFGRINLTEFQPVIAYDVRKIRKMLCTMLHLVYNRSFGIY